MTKKIILAAALIAANILFAYFFIIPYFQKAAALQEQSARAQENYHAQKNYQANVAKALDDIAKRKDQFQKISQALPSGFSSSALAYFLEQISVQTGVAIQSVSLSPMAQSEEKTANLQEMSFTISMSGNYSQVKRFVASLEKSARLFEIESIDFLSTHSLLLPERPYNLKLTVKTHYYGNNIPPQ